MKIQYLYIVLVTGLLCTGYFSPVSMQSGNDGKMQLNYHGKIAFISGRDGRVQIFTIDADGGNVRNISDDYFDNSEPSWSPDGEKIAFASERNENTDIYVMDADGENIQRLNTDPSDDYSPSWSPDGRKIVFMSCRDGNSEIYVMDADGSNQLNLTNNPADDRYPDWCCQPLVVEEPLFESNLQIALLIGVFIVISVIIIFLRHRIVSKLARKLISRKSIQSQHEYI